MKHKILIHASLLFALVAVLISFALISPSIVFSWLVGTLVGLIMAYHLCELIKEISLHIKSTKIAKEMIARAIKFEHWKATHKDVDELEYFRLHEPKLYKIIKGDIEK